MRRIPGHKSVRIGSHVVSMTDAQVRHLVKMGKEEKKPMEHKEYVRPFSREYTEATGKRAHRRMDALAEFVDAGYVAYLEAQLKIAMGFVPKEDQ